MAARREDFRKGTLVRVGFFLGLLLFVLLIAQVAFLPLKITKWIFLCEVTSVLILLRMDKN